MSRSTAPKASALPSATDEWRIGAQHGGDAEKVVMSNSRIFSPSNSLILIEGSDNAEVPEWLGGALVTTTDSCIMVCCFSVSDGPTEFTLGRMHEVDPGEHPVFQGRLYTPDRKIALRSVDGETILESPVPDETTTVRIWVNDPREPDRVIVGTA